MSFREKQHFTPNYAFKSYTLEYKKRKNGKLYPELMDNEDPKFHPLPDAETMSLKAIIESHNDACLKPVSSLIRDTTRLSFTQTPKTQQSNNNSVEE